MSTEYFEVADASHRTIRIMYDGTIWFMASDIARSIGATDTYGKKLNSMFASVPDVWKQTASYKDESADTRLFIAEPGLYYFLGGYTKKTAGVKSLYTNLVDSIIPYIKNRVAQQHVSELNEPAHVEEILGDPDAFIKTLQAYKAEKELREQAEAKSLKLEAENIRLEEHKTALETKIANDAEKVHLAEALETSSTTISIGSFAKVLQNAGYKIAEKKLFSLMYRYRYLIRRGRRHRTAYQKWIDEGYFEVTEKIIHLKDGTEQPIITSMITGKGQMYFLRVIPHLLEKEEQEKSKKK